MQVTLSLESNYKMKIKTDYPILAWLAKRAAIMLNKIEAGQDGRIAYERRKKIGECILYLNPKSSRVDKMDPR